MFGRLRRGGRRLVGRARRVRPRARLGGVEDAVSRVSAELLAAQRALAELEARAGPRLDAMEAQLSAASTKLEHLHPDDVGRSQSIGEDALARADHALATARELSLAARMAAFAAWIELRPPADGVPISIVLASRNRPELLPRALRSVLAQRYARWELLVVDDWTPGSAREVLGEVDDDRISVLAGPRRGLGAARNAGLVEATGDVVCYLDDDNVMHPSWLQAVAHVFAAREDVDVLYGVTIAEHRIPDTLSDDGWWPAFWQLPWSRATLLQENVTDAGALAHRRTLREARFDETLGTGEDWDLLLRLTADRPALAVPAASHAYSIGGGDRMSRDPGHRAGLDEIRRRYT
jgi:hypothetical protein